MIVSVHTNGLFNLSAILIGFQYLYCLWAGKNGHESDLCHCCYSCCVGIPILIVLEWVLKHPSFIAHKLWAPHGCIKPANFLQHYFEILSFGLYIYINWRGQCHKWAFSVSDIEMVINLKCFFFMIFFMNVTCHFFLRKLSALYGLT